MENERFSEFSYGFVLTDELIHWPGTRLTGAPIFPSLQAEGQVGGGYDVKLPGIPLFLQFKLSHRMERRNATETKDHHVYSPRFYRMFLRPRSRSNQHQLFLDLDARGSDVFYVAPAFFETTELNNAYIDHMVVQRSVFFRPSAIGPIDNDARHWIAFRDSTEGHGFFFSDPVKPRRIASVDGKELGEILKRKLTAIAEGVPLSETLLKISKEMVSILETGLGEQSERLSADFRRAAVQLTPVQQIAYFSCTFFDSTFFLVQSKG
jgi:hypothetical protein